MWESATFHVCLSIFLHLIGLSTGLWIWYIFPENPTKSVTRLPTERRRLLVSAPAKAFVAKCRVEKQKIDKITIDDDERVQLIDETTIHGDKKAVEYSPKQPVRWSGGKSSTGLSIHSPSFYADRRIG